jgi:hypothetical protein
LFVGVRQESVWMIVKGAVERGEKSKIRVLTETAA